MPKVKKIMQNYSFYMYIAIMCIFKTILLDFILFFKWLLATADEICSLSARN